MDKLLVLILLISISYSVHMIVLENRVREELRVLFEEALRWLQMYSYSPFKEATDRLLSVKWS